MTHQQGPCDLFHDRLDDVTTGTPAADGARTGDRGRRGAVGTEADGVTGPSDVVTGPLVTFTVTCPACLEQHPLPVTTVAPLLGVGVCGNWLSVELGPVYRLPHTCPGLPA